MRNGLLYLAQPDDMPIYKVGVTGDVTQRLWQFQSQSPHAMRIIRVLDCGPRWRANAYERFIHSWLTRYSSHGEWYTDIDAIHQHFDEVSPAVDITDEIPLPKPLSDKPISLEYLEFILACGEAEEAGVNLTRTLGVVNRYAVKPTKGWRERLCMARSRLHTTDAA